MKLKKVLSLLLALVMTVSLLTLPAHAEDAGAEETSTTAATVNFTDVAPFLPPVSGGVRMLRAPLAAPRAAANFAAKDTATDNGMKISKTATPNVDGSYTITLEAYATGSKTTTVQEKDIPTDIILVLDQSGSMADDIGQVRYTAYTGNNTQNKSNYEKRHNGGSANLWHKLADGSYVSVSVKKSTEYTALSASLVNYETSWGRISKNCYFYYANNLYEKVGDEYKKVELSENKSGDWYNRTYTYTYTFSDGTSISSIGRDSKPNLGSHAPLYTPAADGDSTVYTYTYTDSAGVVQTIGTSTGASTRYTPAFYQRSTTTSGGGSRLNALKSAANAFANAVAVKAAGEDGDITTTADNIDHRIAVVGYADTDWDYDYNTGVFIGNTLNRYEDAAAEVYSTALQDMSTTNGKNNVTASLNALQASGATRTDYGLIMAKGILDANPVPAGETRNRVVIVFTDGSPTDSNGFELNVANAAINNANAIKDSGATVYSIGIFSGADASSAGTEPDEDYYDGYLGSNYTDAEMSAACNWFMQKVSSNNGTPRTPSYYLSAGDSASLNNIFQQISNQIETGGAETTLGSETVVKDIISPYFTLPAGTTASGIRIDTYACTGKDGNTYTWSGTSGGPGGATATVDGDQVSVTGFDFSENWCGTETDAQGNSTVRGNKLVISFEVSPKSGFLGGNEVITNASAGIYENGSAQTPVMTFEQPKVNVPIQDVTVTATDKNVYLKGEVTADQLKDGSEISVGDVKLDLSKATDTDKPYGLDPWQTEYVDITVTVKDKDGNVISDKLENLTEDTTYTVEVTVAPKTTGSTGSAGTPATEKSGKNTPAANINVFKPELTFKDSTAYYGETVPANNDYSSNKVGSETWKHGDTVSTDVTMLGTKPTLDISYTPDESKLKDGKYTKQDVPVAATVKIGTENVNEHTTFVHQDCTTACGWETPATPGAPAFLIHIQTCTLNITKQGGADNESYVFDVNKDGVKYSEVTIQGNGTENLVELPVGTYTIVEDSNWSWRYHNPTYSVNGANLNSTTPTGTIIYTNTKTVDSWLNGFSTVVRNIFGICKK